MATEIVLDASVAAKWYLLDESHVEQAQELRREIEAERLLVIVPVFWTYEVASLFSKAAAAGRLSDEEARLAIQSILVIPRTEMQLPEPLEAFDLARRYGRSLIDCFYLAAAEARACDFWTDDRKLVRALGGRCRFVRWIGDFVPPSAAP